MDITKIKRTKYREQEIVSSSGNIERTQFAYDYYLAPPYVSTFKRILHACIDLICIHIFFIIFMVSISVFLGLIQGFIGREITENALKIIIVSLYIVTPFFYYLITESIFNSTIGHKILGHKIIAITGNKPTLKQIFIRSISRYVPFECFSSFENRAWHDLWSNTLLIDTKKWEQFKLELELYDALS